MKMMKVVLQIGQYLKMQQKKALKELGTTLNFIDIWLELFDPT